MSRKNNKRVDIVNEGWAWVTYIYNTDKQVNTSPTKLIATKAARRMGYTVESYNYM